MGTERKDKPCGSWASLTGVKKKNGRRIRLHGQGGIRQQRLESQTEESGLS